jgi:hypothetical protein
MAFDTAFNIINRAAVEVGLAPLTVGSDPWSSADANIVQLAYLLKSSGDDLLRLRSWTQFRKEHTFTTVAGQGEYPLPSDFRNMIDQSGWNRTNRLPLGGPLSAQEWQYLKSRLTGVVFTVLFRQINKTLNLYPDAPNTPAGYDIAFEYQSLWWVQPDGEAVPTTDSPSKSNDTIWFDPHLMTRKLKYDFLRAKNLDATSAFRDYLIALDAVAGEDAPAPILNASGPRVIDPLLGQHSVPYTNFGS